MTQKTFNGAVQRTVCLLTSKSAAQKLSVKDSKMRMIPTFFVGAVHASIRCTSRTKAMQSMVARGRFVWGEDGGSMEELLSN